MLFCCIHRKWVFTVCWSYEENNVAGRPLPRVAYDVWYVLVYSRTSGQHVMLVLFGDGDRPQSWLQCHQPLMGAPSPTQANQPW